MRFLRPILVTDQADPTSLLLQQRKAPAIFIRMVAISLLLHLAASTMVMLPGRYSGESAAPVFVELAQLPANVLPEPVAAPEEVLPQTAPEITSVAADETAPEMAKLQRVIESTLDQAAKTPEKIHESSIGLGMTSGYFGSFAEGETLRDEIREYYFSLMRRINEVWWLNAGTGSRLGRGASINIRITREGKIASIEFIQGSGDVDYDRLLLEALKKAEPLPPLPRNFPQRMFSAPVRFIPPLNLMLPQFTGKTALPHGVN
jgi:protein TonB